MEVHKNLRYLLAGSLVLTSFISHGNEEKKSTDKKKAPGHFTKMVHVAGLSMLGGLFDTTTGIGLLKLLPYSKAIEAYHEGKPTTSATVKQFMVKSAVNALFYVPSAFLTVYDKPKMITHTRFTEGHLNKKGKERHDSRSTVRDIAVFITARIGTGMLTQFIASGVKKAKIETGNSILAFITTAGDYLKILEKKNEFNLNQHNKS